VQISSEKPKLALVRTIPLKDFDPWYFDLQRFAFDHSMLPFDTDFHEFNSWMRMFTKGLYPSEAIDVFLGYLDEPDEKTRRYPTFTSWFKEINRFNDLHHFLAKGFKIERSVAKDLFDSGYYPSDALDLMTGWLYIEDD